MAALETKWPTLLDVAKATSPGGAIEDIVEIMNETNELLDDMVWYEGNLATGHKTTMRSGIPTPTWRRYYQGVQPTKSDRVTVTDTCGMMADYAEIDADLADLNGNAMAFRAQEDKAHIEGISQELGEAVFTANDRIESEKFLGFNSRFNDLSAENAENILDAGGTGTDNASIWLIGWGPMTCHGIYPKGSTAGIQQEDKGKVTIENADGNGGRMEAYRTYYSLKAGLTVRDWRYIVRIANIDRSLLSSDASTGANLPDLMFEATERLPSLSNTRLAFYMDRKVRTKLRQQVAAGVANSTLTTDMIGGKRIVSFDEIPVKRVDVLQVNEARVV